MKNRKRFILFAAIIVVVIAAATIYMYFSGKDTRDLASVVNFKNDNASGELQKSTGQEEEKSELSDLDLPENLPEGVNTIKLKPVEGKEGQATVISAVDGNNFALAIEASLPDPDEGQSYFAFLAGDLESEQRLAAGKLEKKEGKFVMSFNSTGNLSLYKVLIVTQAKHIDDK